MAVTFESGDGRVGTITLDNPPANSYDIEFMKELSAAIARQLGLVSQLFASEQECRSHVEKLAALPPLAVAEIKRAVYVGVDRPLADGLELERDLIERLFRSRDASEGLNAFVEKRTPEFGGA